MSYHKRADSGGVYTIHHIGISSHLSHIAPIIPVKRGIRNLRLSPEILEGTPVRTNTITQNHRSQFSKRVIWS